MCFVIEERYKIPEVPDPIEPPIPADADTEVVPSAEPPASPRPQQNQPYQRPKRNVAPPTYLKDYVTK